MHDAVIKNFIVLEGLDGAGTTTQSKLLAEKIPGSYLTKEPTDSKIGALIRQVLKKEIILTKQALAYLFAADRHEHLYSKNGIIQRCKDGEIVICDRYLFSSLAYQPLDIEFEKIYELNRQFPVPEVVFFLNTPINECQKRIHIRSGNEEIFEKFTIQENILANYQRGFSYYSKSNFNIISLDGSLAINVLLEQELKCLKEFGII